eukprot:7533310-Pyramimonas_sp.AAC.1
MDDTEWRKLRAAHARCRLPAHGGVSLTDKVVPNGDSSAKVAVAPAVQWCRMLWVANTSTYAMI